MEKHKEALRKLAETNGLGADDFYKDKRGFIIVTRPGIEKIQYHNKIAVEFEAVTAQRDVCIVKATATSNKLSIQSFGGAHSGNCKTNYYIEMAEKRALARVVLKIMNLYESGIFGEDEV